MTLGELISEKGLKQKYLVKNLNDQGVEISEAHFSRVCNRQHVPRSAKFYVELATLLRVTTQDVKDCFDVTEA
jgi:hypothetical protein